MKERRRSKGAGHDGGDAHDRAVRALVRRPLSRAELRERLKREGFGNEEIDLAVSRLEASSHLDDASTALHAVVARANRKGMGRTRMLAELRRRGFTEGDARSAWDRAVEDGLVEPDALLHRILDRRLAWAGSDPGRWGRVYNALLRSGFDPAAIRAALESRRPGLGSFAESLSERVRDDLP